MAGERAEHGCPPDEQCSSETPRGLYFSGDGLSDQLGGDDVLRPTVVGGQQTYQVYADEERTPFVGFDAEVDTSAATVLAASSGAVVVRGETPGNAHLRIVDPADGTLFDRTTIQVRELAHVAVVPSWVDHAFGDPRVSPADVVYLAGTPASPVLALTDRDGQRLIDASITYEAGEGISQIAWDALYADATLPVGVHPFTVHLGSGTTLDAQFTVVERVDRLEPFALSDGTTLDAPLAVGESRVVCVQPYAGARPVAATRLAVEVVHTQRLDVSIVSPCVGVERTQDGPASVTLRLAGVERTITVGTSSGARAARPARAEPPGPRTAVPSPASAPPRGAAPTAT